MLIAGITANGSAALLFVLVYYFATAFFSSDTVLAYISVFDFSQIATCWGVVTRYIPIAAVGLGAFFVGNKLGF